MSCASATACHAPPAAAAVAARSAGQAGRKAGAALVRSGIRRSLREAAVPAGHRAGTLSLPAAFAATAAPSAAVEGEGAVAGLPLHTAAAWTAAEAQARASEWQHVLTPAEADELVAAAQRAVASGTPVPQLSQADFPLPTLGPLLEQFRCNCLHGIGFQLLRGGGMAEVPEAGAAGWWRSCGFGSRASSSTHGSEPSSLHCSHMHGIAALTSPPTSALLLLPPPTPRPCRLPSGAAEPGGDGGCLLWHGTLLGQRTQPERRRPRGARLWGSLLWGASSKGAAIGQHEQLLPAAANGSCGARAQCTPSTLPRHAPACAASQALQTARPCRWAT